LSHVSDTSASPDGMPTRQVAAEPLNCCIAGVLVRVEGLPSPVRGRLSRLMGRLTAPPLSAPTEPALHLRAARHGRGDWTVRVGDGEPEAFHTLFRLLTYLEWCAVTSALSATTGLAAIHGATLSCGDATVLLLAQSGHGKTTLTLGLMERGWEPMSDDITLIDTATLRAHAFPRCFHIDSATRIRLRERSDLEWPGTLALYVRPKHWAEEERRPTTIVQVERDFLGTSASALAPVTRAEAAGAILGGTVHNQLSGSELAHVAVGLASQAHGCYRLNNGVLTEALNLIGAASAE
jgi:hypothetical protein